jgi:hypothetical protein
MEDKMLDLHNLISLILIIVVGVIVVINLSATKKITQQTNEQSVKAKAIEMLTLANKFKLDWAEKYLANEFKLFYGKYSDNESVVRCYAIALFELAERQEIESAETTVNITLKELATENPGQQKITQIYKDGVQALKERNKDG